MSDQPLTPDRFRELFTALTDHAPFGWQTRFYGRLIAGDVPSACDIPTGLGKTSVLAVWLLALAEQAARPGEPLTLPRRLVYIVDRRVVVDQATTEAEALLKKLRDATPDTPLAAVATALGGLAAAHDAGQPFALSTLRGQHADNRRWSHDPARPAVIVGTVDMIGSRLLFSGYGGLGPYGRSQHAALLGQDALIVLDEAQLAPAFEKTLTAIASLVELRRGELGRPFAVMSLTATQRRTGDATPPAAHEKGGVLALEPAELQEEGPVRQRVYSRKALRLAPWDGSLPGKADEVLASRMAREAVDLAGTQGAVVVFANTVTLLDKIHPLLGKLAPESSCLRFTGQMRGFERDRKFSDDLDECDAVYRFFRVSRADRRDKPPPHPVFLLATSAGEVGVNFDADHAVCDLVSLERMAQRFGRVNRYGGEETARITVFSPAAIPEEKAYLARTWDLLSKLEPFADPPGDTGASLLSASPAALGEILRSPDALSAYTPSGGAPPLDPARLDDWSLTSLRQEEFPRPQVSYWLRGITPDDDQAVTQLVWREELRYARNGEDAANMAETCPPLVREILRVPTYRAVDWLAGRLKKRLGIHRPGADTPQGDFAAIRTAAGKWETRTLSEDFADKDRFKADLVNATLVLPATIGGLTAAGYLEDSEEKSALDVLDDPDSQNPADERACRRAVFYGSPASGWKAFDLLTEPGSEPFAEANSYAAIVGAVAKHFQGAGERRYRLKSRKGEPEEFADADDGDAESPFFRVEYFAPARNYKAARGEVLLDDHLADARRCAEGIVSRLGLPSAIRDAVVLAAAWHDLGKRREKWQRAIGNNDPDRFLAKSDSPFYDHGISEGYRHEFGSMMDVEYEKADEVRDHPERDLILHLIAAHHGRGRPDFPEAAYDVPKRLLIECAAAAHEAELRFDRLQRRFGWWGLAYLEALVKCADGIASDRAANPSKDAP